MQYMFLEPIWLFLYSWGMLGVWMIPMQVFRCCILFFSFSNFDVYLLVMGVLDGKAIHIFIFDEVLLLLMSLLLNWNVI